jgi:hypothetical protein
VEKLSSVMWFDGSAKPSKPYDITKWPETTLYVRDPNTPKSMNMVSSFLATKRKFSHSKVEE